VARGPGSPPSVSLGYVNFGHLDSLVMLDIFQFNLAHLCTLHVVTTWQFFR